MKLFSYVVQHDYGHAPNPYFGICTLCRCKFRKDKNRRLNIVELANRASREGEVVWIVGTGGADLTKSAGNGKLVYAMRVAEVLSRAEYYEDPRFRKKRPLFGSYGHQRGDNIKPKGKFEKHDQFVLISRHFVYFGRTAITIPDRFRRFEKRGPGFRSQFKDADITQFVKWIENHTHGRLGEPCGKDWLARRKPKECKLSC